jgi:hypothetical protein
MRIVGHVFLYCQNIISCCEYSLILTTIEEKQFYDFDSRVTSVLRWVKVMVLNATFNNISAISWRLILLMEETGVPEENYRPAAGH